ncbi:LegC family aminotransferase [Chloroflexota bacterium]
MSMSYEAGAPAPTGFVPLCIPRVRGNEWIYVKECLDTNWISSVGTYVTRFEEEMAAYLGVKRAVAVVNGTAGLHTALLILGVQPDDEVIVPSLTFVAPVNAIRYCGAWPVFMDVQRDTWQMDVGKVADFLEGECKHHNSELINRSTGRRVRALLPVHILGHPVDMDPLIELAQKHNLALIEDATESLGAKYRDLMVGTIGDVAVLSFNGNKLISTGGGGMIVTDDDRLADYARYLTTQAKDDPLEYFHGEIGYNYRLTNVLAALGVAQLEQIEDYIAAKRRIAARYCEGLAGVQGLTLPLQADWALSTFWLYTLLVNEKKYGMDSRALLRALRDRGIQTRPLWHPIHRLKPYRDCQAYKVEVADWLYERGLAIPCSVGLPALDQDRVIEAMIELGRK